MNNCDCACTGHGSLATRSQVINTAGLHNDYAFCIGLQAQEIRLGSPDRFPHERCGLGTRLMRASHNLSKNSEGVGGSSCLVRQTVLLRSSLVLSRPVFCHLEWLHAPTRRLKHPDTHLPGYIPCSFSLESLVFGVVGSIHPKKR